MKKTYCKPAIDIVILESKTSLMQTSSVGLSNDTYDTGVTLLSREYDFWDDEEDDDY